MDRAAMLIFALALASLTGTATALHAQQSADELSREAVNPLANLISLPESDLSLVGN